MPNTVNIQVVSNTEFEQILNVTVTGDGTGEEVLRQINTPVASSKLSGTIKSVHGCLSGFSAQLAFGGTPNLYVAQIPSDAYVELNFMNKGIPNTANAKTGSIFLTTSGLGNWDSGSFFIRII